jgi:hypothetical protein
LIAILAKPFGMHSTLSFTYVVLVLVSVNVGIGAESTPVPVSVNEKLFADTSLVAKTAVAFLAPLVPGVKRIVKIALAEGARLAGGGFLYEKRAASVPPKLLDDIARATLPVLVMVKLTSAGGSLNPTGPKSYEETPFAIAVEVALLTTTVILEEAATSPIDLTS